MGGGGGGLIQAAREEETQRAALVGKKQTKQSQSFQILITPTQKEQESYGFRRPHTFGGQAGVSHQHR